MLTVTIEITPDEQVLPDILAARLCPWTWCNSDGSAG